MSIEEAEAQASETEAKGQAYQDKKTEICLYAVVVGELEERRKPTVQQNTKRPKVPQDRMKPKV